jgi:hypothetical protein
MTSLEARIVRLELALARAQMQIATLTGQIGTLEAQGRQASGVSYGSGGGGGGGAFVCLSIPAIAAGGSGTADVYSVSGGATVLATSGATIYNEYNSATTAGRVCTLCANADGTYIIYGQSCA